MKTNNSFICSLHKDGNMSFRRKKIRIKCICKGEKSEIIFSKKECEDVSETNEHALEHVVTLDPTIEKTKSY